MFIRTSVLHHGRYLKKEIDSYLLAPKYESQKILQTSTSTAHSNENSQHCYRPQITTADFLQALKTTILGSQKEFSNQK